MQCSNGSTLRPCLYLALGLILSTAIPRAVRAGDFTIASFATGGRGIPPTPNDIITGPDGILEQVALPGMLRAGQVIMRRRFVSPGGTAEYRLYRGTFAPRAFLKETNLFSFPLPAGADVSKVIRWKVYSEKAANPNLDEHTVYFDTKRIYIRKYSRIYFHVNGRWRMFESPYDDGESYLRSLRCLPDARVRIDGKSVGETPLQGELTLQPGFHEIRLDPPAPLHYPLDTTIFLRPDESRSVAFRLAARFGRLMVSANVEDAAVSLDGTRKGVAPLAFDSLVAGRHDVVVSHPLYTTFDTTVAVPDSGKEIAVQAHLDTNFGEIALRVRPSESDVEVDGESMEMSARGTASLRLSAGPHTVSVSCERCGAEAAKALGSSESEQIDFLSQESRSVGTKAPRTRTHVPHNQAFELSVGERREFDIRLQRAQGTLTVAVEPPAAEVLVDGHVFGLGPECSGVLPAGTHVVSARLEGHEAERDTVVIREDKTTGVSLRLWPQGGVLVTSDPDSAQVLLDSRRRGRTPVHLESVPSGMHRVRVSKEGYVPKEVEVSARPNHRERVHVELLSEEVRDARERQQRRERLQSVGSVLARIFLQCEPVAIGLNAIGFGYAVHQSPLEDIFTSEIAEPSFDLANHLDVWVLWLRISADMEYGRLGNTYLPTSYDVSMRENSLCIGPQLGATHFRLSYQVGYAARTMQAQGDTRVPGGGWERVDTTVTADASSWFSRIGWQWQWDLLGEDARRSSAFPRLGLQIYINANISFDTDKDWMRYGSFAASAGFRAYLDRRWPL